ncbi:hypothetical protein JX265_013677 [Neoarthrinium moseri]|uniref:Reverse transcriptase domain-containing protein n=1 Tax=Neoarthrinium moseri TaxID=1658444 RepID=A0A9Q0AHF0_9PEZI|nr:hypothetical protein JX265_013677 [Neoarthrinium moseri]
MDLTKLRKTCTYWRNQARSRRRSGRTDPGVEHQAREAGKTYHTAIRKQKKTHWHQFLEENANIWQAARQYTGAGIGADPDVLPTIAAEIDDEGARAQRAPVAFPRLTMEEVDRQTMAASPWKAAGEDGLPVMVWKQVWPVVKERVLSLFQLSLDTGELPHQWRQAKIIPLKKAEKPDYAKAKAWRPISLLSTLGKILESVIAERLSYLVETMGLLPTNHFGGRKQRSAEQALMLLQEQIYKAWRSRRVLSLVSFTSSRSSWAGNPAATPTNGHPT